MWNREAAFNNENEVQSSVPNVQGQHQLRRLEGTGMLYKTIYVRLVSVNTRIECNKEQIRGLENMLDGTGSARGGRKSEAMKTKSQRRCSSGHC